LQGLQGPPGPQGVPGSNSKIAIGTVLANQQGNISVTGLGFTPKYVKFNVIYHRQILSGGGGISMSGCWGAMTATSQYAVELYSNFGTSRSLVFTDRVIHCSYCDTSDPDILATFVSFDTDGFTLNFTIPNSGYTVVWEAWE